MEPRPAKFRKLASMFNEKTFADAVIRHQGTEVFVHKVILCQSEYFNTLFRSNMGSAIREKNADGLPVYELPEPDASLDVVLFVLRLLYDEKMPIPTSDDGGSFVAYVWALIRALQAPEELAKNMSLATVATPSFWITLFETMQILNIGNFSKVMKQLWKQWTEVARRIRTGHDLRLPAAECAKLMCVSVAEIPKYSSKQTLPATTFYDRLFSSCDFLWNAGEVLSEITWLIPIYSYHFPEPQFLRFFGAITSKSSADMFVVCIHDNKIYGTSQIYPKVSSAALGLHLDLTCKLQLLENRVQLAVHGKCQFKFDHFELCAIIYSKCSMWYELIRMEPDNNWNVDMKWHLPDVKMTNDNTFHGGMYFAMRATK